MAEARMLYEQLAGSTIGRMILTAAAAMIPVGELRFAMPYGVALGLPWHLAFLSSVAGNIVPVPLIFLIIRPVFSWLKKRTRLGGLISRLEKRVFKKAESVYRYEMLGYLSLSPFRFPEPAPGQGRWRPRSSISG
jgi:uncharacterized membrane protein